MKKSTIAVIIIAIVFTLMAGSRGAEAGNMTILVNGTQLNTQDNTAFVDSNNRTLVPVRFVAEALGADVQWVGETRNVIINKDTSRIVLRIDDSRAILNDAPIRLDTKAVLKNSRTFVPIRFIGEALKCGVSWDASTNTVYIETEEKQGNFVEPVIEVVYNNNKWDPKYFDINLSNYKDYDENYTFKLEFINYPVLNVREQKWGRTWTLIDESAIKPYSKIKATGWLYTMFRYEQTTRENTSKFTPIEGLQITFKLTVKKGYTQEREYYGSATIPHIVFAY